MTFSIVARDPVSGALGMATATGMPAVGGFVPHVRAAAGAIATQGFSTNRLYGEDGLALLARGWTAQEVIDAVTGRDQGCGWRQCLIVDREGRTAAHTGDRNEGAIAVEAHDGVAFGGNMLADRAVIEAMRKSFALTGGTELVDRLLAALVAGEAAGGDKRGTCSAALVVEWPDGARLDLRIDDDPTPIPAMERLLARMRDPRVQTFLARVPIRADPHRA